MTIREKVTREMYESWWQEIEGFNGDPYFGSNADLWKNWLPAADRTITAFLKAAAEDGWHMQRDEATEKMCDAGWDVQTIADKDHMATIHRAMQAASDEFELDK